MANIEELKGSKNYCNVEIVSRESIRDLRTCYLYLANDIGASTYEGHD